ncbi:uncharacterized protein V1516DRAFT_495460 [Lipomyces oligophaga]|uniref:uncharacterized protein n=1 Tax=Lipomyces oligophaga TaxID=45792 RepID=UPI0034CFC493
MKNDFNQLSSSALTLDQSSSENCRTNSDPPDLASLTSDCQEIQNIQKGIQDITDLNMSDDSDIKAIDSGIDPIKPDQTDGLDLPILDPVVPENRLQNANSPAPLELVLEEPVSEPPEVSKITNSQNPRTQTAIQSNSKTRNEEMPKGEVSDSSAPHKKATPLNTVAIMTGISVIASCVYCAALLEVQILTSFIHYYRQHVLPSMPAVLTNSLSTSGSYFTELSALFAEWSELIKDRHEAIAIVAEFVVQHGSLLLALGCLLSYSVLLMMAIATYRETSSLK